MKAFVHKDSYGIQITTSHEERDHCIELESISELMEVSLAINRFIDSYYKQENNMIIIEDLSGDDT